MSSMPQTTACVLGLRSGRENSKPAELSGQARRLRQRGPPETGLMPCRAAADLFTRTYQLGCGRRGVTVDRRGGSATY